jgi:hypothetical protein
VVHGELLSQAGMQPMPAHGLTARKDTLRYQLLETMTAVMHTDTKLVLDGEGSSGGRKKGVV